MQAILQHLFKKDSLEEVHLSALQQLTQLYPFFAPGQFLLTNKLQQTGSKSFEVQLQRTAVYFQNPLWLEHQLTTQEHVVTAPDPAINQLADTPPVHYAEQAETSEIDAPLVEEAAMEVDHTQPLPAADLHTATTTDEDNALQEQNDADANETDYVEPDHADMEPLLKNILHMPADTDTIEFQAYHTIDYFASQGIHLHPDDHSADKLDKQLKSFTDWLKTMRRLPQANKLDHLEKVNEEAIYQQASGSLQEREIITETMAEVLVKQQNIEKAIETYYKLGLLNPSKKVYFAAKIKALKQ